MPFAFHYAARSDVGMVRTNNEDSGYAGPHLLAMADGMGGHAGGDVASSTVIAALVTSGVELSGVLTAKIPAAVVGGAKGAASVAVSNLGDVLATGTMDITLYASGDAELGTDDRAFLTLAGRPVKLKPLAARGKAKAFKLKFTFPTDLPDGSYFLLADVDASGSMGARRRMAQVKAAVLGLLTDAYQRRDKVALVTFRGDEAVVQLAPTSSVERAAEALRTLPTGGKTPLAQGLEQTELIIRTEQRRDPSRRALAIIVTDGRAGDRAAALHAIHSLSKAAAGVVVLDLHTA